MPTVLVAEDDPDLRRAVAEALRSRGFDVVEAEDGAACLAALERGGADLLVLDYHLPDLTGASVAEHLRRSRQLAGLPTLFITGDHRRAAALAGEAAVLRKPFGAASLHSAVEAALGRGKARGAAGGLGGAGPERPWGPAREPGG